nr:uncharacterized protein LOC128685749 [Cherax quadricarinatus]
MQSPDRHDHAQSCYSTTYKRANALLQWFDTVINTTIMKDLHDINQKVMAKTLELRRERVRLIQEKAQQMWGTNIDLDTTLGTTSVDLDQLSRGLVTDGQAVKVDGDVESQRAGTPPPLSEDELAPMPSNTVIFGNMYDHYQRKCHPCFIHVPLRFLFFLLLSFSIVHFSFFEVRSPFSVAHSTFSVLYSPFRSISFIVLFISS